MAPTNPLAVIPALFAQSMPIHGIVLPVFCAFFLFQLCLYLSHRRAVTRQRRALDALCQAGDAPEPDLVQGSGNGLWVGWVSKRFHDGAFHDGHYSREAALGELDNWLEGYRSYLALQRMGIAAPMVGLLITVVGFFFLQPPTAGNGDLKQILYALTPLILGVGTGASLALINQVLLHCAGNNTDALRTAACRWFDDCVWKFVQRKPQVAADNAADALQVMAETMRTSVDVFRGATTAIGNTSQSLQTTGKVAAEAASNLRTQMAVASEELQGIQTTAKNVLNSANGVVPAVEAVTTDLAEAAGVFRTVVQVQLGQAATRHQESAELFARSVEKIQESAGQMSAQFVSFGQIVNAQATASQELAHSLRSFQQAGSQLTDATKDLAPAQRAFHDAVDSMKGSAQSLESLVREGVEPATRRLAELDQMLARMQETTEAVRQMTQLRQEFAVLARSLSQAAAAADAFRGLQEEMRAMRQAAIPNRNGNTGPRRPWYLRIVGIGRRSNGRV